MLGVLCARPKPWILVSLSNFIHGSAAHHHHHHQSRLLVQSPIQFDRRQRHHSSACKLAGGGAASIWHAILPSGAGSGSNICRPAIHCHERKGEGSWNVAWDARPARWLHRPDSAWLLFGVCACIAPLDWVDASHEAVSLDQKKEGCESSGPGFNQDDESSADYRVTGVLADGRCLFRAIAHGACLRSGEAAPDDDRQRELADELRAKVVDELLKRRKETEWYIEGDFDAYVKRIQQPFVWGGEPELLMASHVLKTPISVFMRERSSDGLINIAKYGQEYQKGEESPINVLFHGYGHYDILETSSDKVSLKLSM